MKDDITKVEEYFGIFIGASSLIGITRDWWATYHNLIGSILVVHHESKRWIVFEPFPLLDRYFRTSPGEIEITDEKIMITTTHSIYRFRRLNTEEIDELFSGDIGQMS